LSPIISAKNAPPRWLVETYLNALNVFGYQARVSHNQHWTTVTPLQRLHDDLPVASPKEVCHPSCWQTTGLTRGDASSQQLDSQDWKQNAPAIA
jgi:hypothetical protein